MGLNRRIVLKGMALSSMAGLAKGALADTAELDALADARPLVALVNEGAAGSVFLRGVEAVNGLSLQLQTINADLHSILALDRRLRSGEAVRVIGLLDDASGTLVVDFARSAGARVNWLGQHTAHAGVTRHRLLNAERVEECAERLARHLHDCGAGFHIFAQQHGDDVSHDWNAQPRAAGSIHPWPSVIGYLLASLNAPVTRGSPPLPGDVVTEGKFVSFSIET